MSGSLGERAMLSEHGPTDASFSEFSQTSTIETRRTYLLFIFSINLLAIYHECRSLIGYAAHYLFCDRY